jgi:hypothetical protein
MCKIVACVLVPDSNNLLTGTNDVVALFVKLNIYNWCVELVVLNLYRDTTG